MNSRVFVIIYGKVQGVWFRVHTKNKADQLEIKGWVRNTSNGTVEALFEGENQNIEEILEWCNHGPPLAKVDKIKIKKQPVSNDLYQFSILY
jgi:acylphosphatase